MVQTGGKLKVAGTNTKRVVFTSYKDDSLNGDTNGDGVSTPQVGDYESAVLQEGGSITVAYATFKYANISIHGLGIYGNDDSIGTAQITDSLFQLSGSGLVLPRSDTVLKRNTFEMAPGSTSAFDVGYVKDLSGLVITGADKNIFSGNVASRIINISLSELPSGKSWVVDKAGGLTNMNFGNLTIRGTMTLSAAFSSMASQVYIDGGTLTVQAGSTFKIANGGYGFFVKSGGKLLLNASTTTKTTFTSECDPVVGGSCGDTPPSKGIYMSAVKVEPGGTLTMASTKVLYATAGLDIHGVATIKDSQIMHSSLGVNAVENASVQFDNTQISQVVDGIVVGDSAEVRFKGAFKDVASRAIVACDWNWDNVGCVVDASFTDWGSASGPFLSGQSLACGQVLVAPWKYNGSIKSGSPLSISNCDSTQSINEQLKVSSRTYQDALNPMYIKCDEGYEDFCAQAKRRVSCVEDGIAPLVQHGLPYSLPNLSITRQAYSFVDGTSKSATQYFVSIKESAVQGFKVAKEFGKTATLLTALHQAYKTCTQ